MFQPSILTILIIAAVAIYIITIQFLERAVRPLTLLLLPVLAIYASYSDVVKSLANPVLPLALAIVAMGCGLLLGVALGWYRGGLARLRLDYTAQTVFYRPSNLSKCLWVGLLLVKIVTYAIFYSGWMHTSLLVVLLILLACMLFVGAVLAEKSRIFYRAQRYHTPNYPVQRNA